MSEKNKAILEEGNAAIARGDNEGFLRFCADDTEWTFVGDQTLKGKEAVRQYMATVYVEPPKFKVENLIAEGDFVTALGDITLKDEDGKATGYSYCDVWHFRSGKIVGLKAFVIKPESKFTELASVKRETDVTLETLIRAGELAAAIDFVHSGADANRRDPEGLTPLMIASGLGQSQMVEFLLTARAEIHAIEPRIGVTALHKAAQSGNADVIGLLLDHGTFIDQQSPVLGHTPLMDAVVYKQEAAVRLLLKRGARTTIRNHWQQTALELAQLDKLAVIARLIKARNEADTEQVRGQTLMTAVKAGNLREVKRLLAAGATVNERVPMVGSLDDDYTPLGLAAREGHTDIARVLLDAGANPRQVIGLFKGTPLHEASYFGYAEIVRTMTQKPTRAGAPAPEIDARGLYNGFTALHDAVWHGHSEAARALVEAGARLDLRTHAGLMPRELAVLYGYDDLARFLAEAERE